MIWVVEFPALQDEIKCIYSKGEPFKKGHNCQISKKYLCRRFCQLFVFLEYIKFIKIFSFLQYCFSLGVSKWACSKKENLEYVCILFKVPKTKLWQPKWY